jgi:hypothetical protein
MEEKHNDRYKVLLSELEAIDDSSDIAKNTLLYPEITFTIDELLGRSRDHEETNSKEKPVPRRLSIVLQKKKVYQNFHRLWNNLMVHFCSSSSLVLKNETRLYNNEKERGRLSDILQVLRGLGIVKQISKYEFL